MHNSNLDFYAKINNTNNNNDHRNLHETDTEDYI